MCWLGSGVGALVGLFGLAALFLGSGPEHAIMGGIFVAIATGAWLAGRACLYMLAGR